MTRYGSQKEVRKILDQLEDQGWRVRMTNNGHWRCLSPDGKTIVIGGSTPGIGRSIANFKAELRRGGAIIQ